MSKLSLWKQRHSVKRFITNATERESRVCAGVCVTILPALALGLEQLKAAGESVKCVFSAVSPTATRLCVHSERRKERKNRLIRQNKQISLPLWRYTHWNTRRRLWMCQEEKRRREEMKWDEKRREETSREKERWDETRKEKKRKGEEKRLKKGR